MTTNGDTGRGARLLALLALPLDLILALLLGAGLLPLALLGRLDRRPRRRRLALLVPGGDVASIRAKFGSLDPYLQDSLDGYFEHCYRFLYGDRSNARIELRGDFTVYPRRIPLGVLRLTYLSRLAVEISALALRRRVAVLHAKDPYLCGLVVWVAAAVSRTPFCVSIHSDYQKWAAVDGAQGPPAVLGRYAGRVASFVLRRAHRVMPISRHLAVLAERAGAPSERIRVAPHGVDTAAFEAAAVTDVRTRFAVPPGVHLVTFLGRLAREKFADDALGCARLLAGRRRDFVLIMAGSGPEEARLRQEAADPILAERVRIVGFQPHDVCQDLLCGSSAVLCLLSGFVLIEALAAVAPVVAYDVEWHGEVVDDGETGLLVAEGDVEGLARAVDLLLDHPEAARRMAEEGRRRVRARYGLGVAQAVKRSCYEELLSPAGAAS